MRLRVLLAGALLLGLSAGAAAQTRKHNCDFCHNLHGGSNQALTDSATSQALCEGCHGDLGPATWNRNGEDVPIPKNVAIHDGLKHSTPTSCWNCHDHEGEAEGNRKMIPLSRTGAAGGATRAIVFTDTVGTNSFADGDGTYDGVCEVCHSATNYHRFDGSGPGGAHNGAADCRTCHKHDGGFQGGGNCTACHNQAQGGRRIIVSEFTRTSHHVDWQAAGYAAADSIPNSDCTTCHDQSKHQQGNVRLWNVDAPGDTTQVIVLTADPYTNTAEAAKLEPFCLNCHDANGAAGDLIPFSDGITRPQIDATAWPVASHSTTASIPGGCYGNGASGCHATGHGSQKANLLGPPTVAATAPALAEEQEGFCLSCHDGSPAATNLKLAYDQPINWVQQPTGLSSNANLNDRHDVQYAAQTRSGARIECVSCHNPHSATAAQPWKIDPDPSDGHVPGVNWYFTAYQSANDRLSEFCLDCHDGSFPTGVLDHTSVPITNIRTTWVNDGMGARTSSSQNLRSGNGWAAGDVLPCKACHVAHIELDNDVGPAPGTPSLFAVVDTVRNKAGTAYIPFQDRKASDPLIYNYAITNNQNTSDYTSGGYWCNSCHNRYAMTGKVNCYGCHRHGDGGRF